MENLVGTSFQKEVWQEIKKIPKGETRTYKDIAIAINNKPKSMISLSICLILEIIFYSSITSYTNA